MKIIIDKTVKTPYVRFDTDDRILEISGRSFPEDARKFYKEIFDEITNYKLESLKIILSFEYINTASTKLILDMLKKSRRINNISVTWVTEEGDFEMVEMGEYVSLLSEIEFDYETIEEY